MRLKDIVLLVAAVAGASTGAAAQTATPQTAAAQPVNVAALAPPAPDYALASSWSAGPGGPGASAALPAGASPAARLAGVDVFYVHPPTLRSDT